MAITHADYMRARYICSEASLYLGDALYPDNRGGRSLDPLIWLVGAFLAQDKYNSQLMTKVLDVLNNDLPRPDRWDLGVLRFDEEGKVHQLTETELYQLSKRVTLQLSFTMERAGHHPSEVRQIREIHLERFTEVLLKPTQPDRPEGGTDWAIDGTGIWAAERYRKSFPKENPPEPIHEEIMEEGEQVTPPASPMLRVLQGGALDAPPKRGRGHRSPSEARVGFKTSKNGGVEWYFGYDVETICRVPKIWKGEEKLRPEPSLIQSLVVLPAGTGITAPSLRLLDRMLERGLRIEHLIVDRHYSYKEFTSWAAELIKRGISQITDLHKNDQGFKPWDGMKMAAGWAHCPKTPEHLGVIPTLAPNATDEEKEVFTSRINERQAYAAQRISTLTAELTMRFSCPALNGTVGCPLREGTVAAASESGRPIISDPPQEIGRPSICTQKTVQIRAISKEEKIALKVSQRHYWGSKSWRLNYSRRTYIEGDFGVFKNPTCTGYDRESHQFQGLPLVTISVAIAAAVTNLNLLRSWHKVTNLGDPNHPLLTPDEESFGLVELTKAQADAIDDFYRKKAA